MNYPFPQAAPPAPAEKNINNQSRGLIGNENGSVMVLTLMIMAVMMVIVIASTETVVTENFIIRNVGIHKENLNMVESALMEGLQTFMQVSDDDPANFATNASPIDWINDRTNALFANTWYDANDVQTILNNNNSRIADEPNILTTRGEAGNGNLRYAVVGWSPVTFAAGGSGGLVVGPGKLNDYEGRIVAEYVSADAGGIDNGNGRLRMEIGVRRRW